LPLGGGKASGPKANAANRAKCQRGEQRTRAACSEKSFGLRVPVLGVPVHELAEHWAQI
jgi:hypothetical protein